MVKHWKFSGEIDLAQKNWDFIITLFNTENYQCPYMMQQGKTAKK